MTTRTLTLGASTYPLVLPNIRDPRLHVAAVTLSVHALGQLGLGFAVSIPQVLAAILSCAVIEIVLTFRQTRSFVWPASAMLTGSGVALILRIGTSPDDHWSTNGWWVYAGVAGLSLLTKYVIRYRGNHIFNPSNVGLVAAFVLLGSSRVEPLDFWWSPLNAWMIAAYMIIVGGGTLITRRLKLLVIAASFWVTFATGIGLLSASGHCMVANWAFAPVCGFDFWRIIVTSPEVMIFLFFMITDPRTVPTGRVARPVFGFLVAVLSTLLIAPQTNEFGAKVGLLAGLTIMSTVRPLLEHALPQPRSAADTIRSFLARLAGRSGGAARVVLRGAVGIAAVLVLGAGIVAAGSPARGLSSPDVTEVLTRVPYNIDPATLPTITVQQDVGGYDLALVGPGAQQLVVTMGENLQLENEALLRKDASILTAVDHGDRLDEMQGRLKDAIATGRTTISIYRFDSITMSLLAPFGRQSGLSIGMDSLGTLTQETYDASGTLQSRTIVPFANQFVIRRAMGGRWLNVAVLPRKGS